MRKPDFGLMPPSNHATSSSRVSIGVMSTWSRAMPGSDVKGRDHTRAPGERAMRHLSCRLSRRLAGYDRALALDSDHMRALGNRGNALSLLNRHEDAIASYDRALALAPDFVDALTNRSTALLALKRHDEALAGYDQALAIKPDHVDALFNRGNAARLLKRYEEALASYQRALALQPSHPHAFNGMAHCALAICDWTTVDA